jgi:uncharacterized protein YfaS (alpha-2-macroglobulin family)
VLWRAQLSPSNNLAGTPIAQAWAVHPYRSERTAPGDSRRARAARYLASKKRMIAAGLGLGAAVAVTLLVRTQRHASAPAAPPELLWTGSVFPPPDPELPPSVPLAPLLAADTPEQLAAVEPVASALNVRMGEPVTVRFNRPMVDGTRVGKDAKARVLVFEPPVRGRTVWTSRSAASFEAEPSSWSRTHVAAMSLAPELRSLADETPAEFEARTVVFDAGPRVARGPRALRLLPGEPASFLFSGHVDPAALRPLIMAYEVDGGQRALPFALAGRGRDAEGRTRVDVLFGRVLEQGAQFAVAMAPPIASGGASPRVWQLEMAPRPRIEGIACPAEANEASACAFQGPPGGIVDIEESLRLLATTPLREPTATVVRTSPPLANLKVTLEDKTLLTLRGDWTPGQVYEVRVEGLVNADGQRLAPTAPLAVRSAGRRPEVRGLAGGSLAYESDARAEMTFSAIHVDAGEVRIAEAHPGEEIEAALGPEAWIDADGRATEVLGLPALAPASRANRWGRGALAWRDRTSGHGSMAVVSFVPQRETDASVEGRSGRSVALAPQTMFAQQTDLGIDAKRLAAGTRIWVTTLGGAQPVAGASVEVADGAGVVQGRLSTDDRGFAWLPMATSAPEHRLALPRPAGRIEAMTAVKVVRGDDRAVLVVDRRKAMGPQHLGTTPGADPPPPEAWRAAVMTDRGIVRPGETVHARAIVRVGSPESLRIPAPLVPSADGGLVSGLPSLGFASLAEVLLFGPSDDAPLARRLVKLSAFGSVDADFSIDGTAAPGTFRVEVRQPGDVRAAGTASFAVGHYQPPAVRVDLATPSPDLDDRDPLRVDVTAHHMFGPPAAGLPAHWTLTREAGGESPARWPDYVFDAVGATAKRGTVDAGDVVLGPDGRATITTAIAMGGESREKALFEIDVRDPSGRTSSARQTVTTYRAHHEVGIRRSRAWLDHGSMLDIDAVVIEHDGTPSVGRKVRARVLREGWHTYWEWSGGETTNGDEGGAYQARRTHRSEVVKTCDLVSKEGAVHCVWRANRPGTYVLEASTRDEAGRTSIASERVYVAGPDEHPDRDPPGTAIALTPSKSTWSVGETADVAFESPFEDAEALIEVEREGVLLTETRRVGKGGSVVRFAVTPQMVPNAFVALSLVRPRTGPPQEKLDLDAPDLRVGLAEIAVRPSAGALDVRVEVGEHAPAGSEVPVDVLVTDANGHGVAAEVALYAVDEATLRVTGYRTPDPLAELLPRISPEFSWEDLRRALVSRTTAPPSPEAGGDGDSSGAASRPLDDADSLDPTVLWLPHEPTDETGRVHAVLRLPARAATYRVMALAMDAGARGGRAEASLVGRLPIVVRPALPAVATVGDRFEAAALVHNASDVPADVTIVTSVDDAVQPEARAHLEPNGEVRVAQSVLVTARHDMTVRFVAKPSGGGADGAEARVESRVHVVPRGREVRREVVGAVAGSREITVRLPDGADDASLTLSVARQPLVGLDAALEALVAYPNDDVEPVASSLLGLAAWSRLDTGKRPSSLSPDEIAARAASALALIALAQNDDGGFGLFSSEESSSYLTTYVLHALCAARDAGFAVDGARIERARALLATRVGANTLDGASGPDDLAFALRALAEAGTPNAARLSSAFVQRDLLSPYGLAELALAMGVTGGPANEDRAKPSGGVAIDLRRDTLIVEAVDRALAMNEDERRRASSPRWYDGSARTLGTVLEAAASAPHTVASSNMARLAGALLRARDPSAAAWSTTHETGHALAGLAAYAAAFRTEEAIAPRVTLDGRVVEPAERGAALAWYKIPLDGVGEPHDRTLRIAVGGSGYFALAGRWTAPLGPADETARGATATLHRVLEDAAGKPLGADPHVRLGDLVRVRLFLYTEPQAAPPPYVAVRDHLPGGLEPIDVAHETSPRGSLWALLGMGPDDDTVDARGFYAARSLDDLTARAFVRGEAVLTLSHASPGLREYTYGARASAVGTFVAQPAEIRALYAPAFEARSAALTLTVEP